MGAILARESSVGIEAVGNCLNIIVEHKNLRMAGPDDEVDTEISDAGIPSMVACRAQCYGRVLYDVCAPTESTLELCAELALGACSAYIAYMA